MIVGAMAIAVALGLGAALLIGGTVADGWDGRWPGGVGAPLALKGWQAAFIVAALPGLPLGLALVVAARAGARRRRRHPAAPRSRTRSAPAAARSARSCRSRLLVKLRARRARRPGCGRSTWPGSPLIALAVALLTAWTDGLRAADPSPLQIGGLGPHRQRAAMDRVGLRRLYPAELAAVAAARRPADLRGHRPQPGHDPADRGRRRSRPSSITA